MGAAPASVEAYRTAGLFVSFVQLFSVESI
jgi:hypothetical protein